MNSETIDAGYVSIISLLGDQGGVDLKYDIVEGGAEVRAIDSRVTGGFGIVDVFALCAIKLYSLDIRVVGLSHR